MLSFLFGFSEILKYQQTVKKCECSFVWYLTMTMLKLKLTSSVWEILIIVNVSWWLEDDGQQKSSIYGFYHVLILILAHAQLLQIPSYFHRVNNRLKNDYKIFTAAESIANLRISWEIHGKLFSFLFGCSKTAKYK